MGQLSFGDTMQLLLVSVNCTEAIFSLQGQFLDEGNNGRHAVLIAAWRLSLFVGG